MTERRIGVMGGTFDPIHVGHLAAAEDATWKLGLERVLFVPNNIPPHKLGRPISSTPDRLAMVEEAVRDNPRFTVSRAEVDRPGPSYTLDTLRRLQQQLGPQTHLVFLAGRDALQDLHAWHHPDTLLREFDMVFLCRPDSVPLDWSAIDQRFPGLRDRVELVDIPELEVSSSDIRARVREGRPIRYYVTPPVQRYIEEHGLYRS